MSVRLYVTVVVEVGVVVDSVVVGVRGLRCVQWEGVVCVTHSVSVVVYVFSESRGAAADDSVRLIVVVGVYVRVRVSWEGVVVVTVVGFIRVCWGVIVGVVLFSRVQREGVGVVVVTVIVVVCY